MEMRNGMLGVVIVALALTGALLGGYFAGVQAEENEVLKYNYLTDITPLFDSDQTPQYISFDPSSNYTGYYSEDTYSNYLQDYYFDQEKVGFVPNVNDKGTPQVNNYRITQDVTMGAAQTVDIRELNPTQLDNNYILLYVYSETDFTSPAWGNRATTVSSLMDAMGLSESYGSIRISLADANWNAPLDNDRMDLNTVIIMPSGYSVKEGSARMLFLVNPNINLDTIQDQDPSDPFYYPYKSFEINLANKTVKAFANDDYTGWDNKTWSADSMIVYYDISTRLLGPALDLSQEMEYYPVTVPPAKYLNPNNGVWMKEASA